jgi:signal transduction histidine kinase
MTSNERNADKEQLMKYIEFAERLKQGQYDHFDLLASESDTPLTRLGLTLYDLAQLLELHDQETQRIDQITARINAGLLLDEVLENVYEDFRALIPYDRIGLALLEDDGQTVTSRWNRTDRPPIYLRRGYSAPLAGSSLETIIQTGQPRILNDLIDYQERKSSSESTRLILEEGIRSSLTCPLIANGVPVGFIFFSSAEPNSYHAAHITVFQRIAAQLAVIVEKGRLASELAEQKRAIERQNQELLRLNDLKNTFLGIAAHDLRNPLGVIEMALGLLLDPKIALTPQETDTILRDTQHQSRHMLNLINELLDVSQIEAGRVQLQHETVVIQDFLVETVQRHAKLAAPKGTHIHLESDLSSDDLMNADPLRMRQVVDNLISNAVKYSPAGSTIYVRAEKLENHWRISVQDEGPGLTPEDQSHLFQDFVRLSARPTGGESSTGLGLAISRRVVEAHHGQIGVETEPGQGATFWFTIPA